MTLHFLRNLGISQLSVFDEEIVSFMKKKLREIDWIYQDNVFLKAKLQERKAAAELAYYQAEAIRKGIVALEGEKLTHALWERLKSRGVKPVFKKKEELHIFLTYYVSNWEAILPKVLKSFGKVTEFEWRTHGFDDRSPDWVVHRGRMNEAMLVAFYEAYKRQPVDVVVGYLSGYNTDPRVLNNIP